MSAIEKRHYLVGKLINETRALSQFFDEVKNKSVSPTYLVNELAKEYDLTVNQRRVLGKISTKLTKARTIITYLNDKYKPSEKGNAAGKSTLFKDIYQENPPKEFGIRSFSFAFGIYLPHEYFEDNTCGDAGANCFSLETVVDYNIKQIEKKEPNFKNLRALCFRINHQDPVFLDEYTEKGQGNTSAEKHELKHIIDSFISGWEVKKNTDELSADLFAGIFDRNNILLEIETEKSRLEKLNDRYKKQQKANIPESCLNNTKNAIDKTNRKIRSLEKFPINLMYETSKLGLSFKEISYLVATTHIEQLEYRLKLIKEHLSNKR